MAIRSFNDAWTIDQLAKRLQKSVPTIQRWCRTRPEIKAVRFAREYRIPAEIAEALVEGRPLPAVEAAAEPLGRELPQEIRSNREVPDA